MFTGRHSVVVGIACSVAFLHHIVLKGDTQEVVNRPSMHACRVAVLYSVPALMDKDAQLQQTYDEVEWHGGKLGSQLGRQLSGRSLLFSRKSTAAHASGSTPQGGCWFV